MVWKYTGFDPLEYRAYVAAIAFILLAVDEGLMHELRSLQRNRGPMLAEQDDNDARESICVAGSLPLHSRRCDAEQSTIQQRQNDAIRTQMKDSEKIDDSWIGSSQ